MSALPLAPVNDYITRKYNFVRLCLYNLITYHSYLQSYIEEYKIYLKKIEREFPIIHTILEKREIETIPSIAQQAKKFTIKNKKMGRIYIIGKEATEKYLTIISLCKQFYSYDEQIEEYTRFLERSIISLTRGINDFRKSYELHLSMCLEKEEFSETMLTQENFNKIIMKYKTNLATPPPSWV